MELILLLVVTVGLVFNIVLMRYFFKRLSDKINFITQSPSDETFNEKIDVTGTKPFTNGNTIPQGINLFNTPIQKPERAAPNELAEEENDFELNEQIFSNLPADIKVEVEGGDTQTPPGFENKNN